MSKSITSGEKNAARTASGAPGTNTRRGASRRLGAGDVIEQGSALAKERFQARQEAEEQAAMPDEQVITTTYYW